MCQVLVHTRGFVREQGKLPCPVVGTSWQGRRIRTQEILQCSQAIPCGKREKEGERESVRRQQGCGCCRFLQQGQGVLRRCYLGKHSREGALWARGEGVPGQGTAHAKALGREVGASLGSHLWATGKS